MTDTQSNMRIQGSRFPIKKSKGSVTRSKASKAKEEISALLQAINAIGMCENNWGQPQPKRRKWIFLHAAHMTKNSKVELPRLGPWARN